jgi:hypothetical protein
LSRGKRGEKKMIYKFSDDIVQKVWEKGVMVTGEDSSRRRKDVCGAWISRSMYGDRSSQYNEGWEVDHITAGSDGGTDDLSNLRPLQWHNNASRQDGPLTCPVKAR